MKSNAQIVLRYLEMFEGQGTVQLPDGYRYGMLDNKLCLILTFSEYDDGEWIKGEDSWTVYDGSFNYFIEQCTLLTETDIMGIVFALGTSKEKKDGRRHADISG